MPYDAVVPDQSPPEAADAILTTCPVIPVVVLDHPAQALPLGAALLAGGIDVVEITLRTDAGLDAIRALSTLTGLRVGAGTVLRPDQVDQAVDAGATFIVSPGLSVGVLDRARARGVPALPGVATPSELMTAVGLGLTEVKFFPAGVLGGPAAIKALAAPFRGVSFLPSGGVSPDNLADYLAVPAVAAVSGSWMVDPALLRAGRWDEVTARSSAALALAERARRPAAEG